MEDILEVIVIDGKVRCIYVNDYRVAGSKPYVSEQQSMTVFKVQVGEIRKQLKRKQRAPAAKDGAQ